MARFLLLIAIAITACPTIAHACVWLPSPTQTESQKRYWSRVETQARKAEAMKRLKAGEVRFADELAEMLVPNVRPIMLRFSDCGPEGEIDFAGGIDGLQALTAALSSEPRLKEVQVSEYTTIIRRSAGEIVPGPSCNYEFRKRFSDWLAGNLAEADVRYAWLFLVPRTREIESYGSVYHRLTVFTGSTRRPPLQWRGADRWISKDITRFVTRDAVGKRLDGVIKSFWARYESELDRDDLICPIAAATSFADRGKLVDAILLEQRARQLRSKKKPS